MSSSKVSNQHNLKKNQQKGGAGSDFANLWYSWEVSPAELSRVTLEKIDCAPMFNPLRKGTVIPTGTSGIIPAGVYLAALPPLVDSCATVECFNRGQVGLVTDAQQVALQRAVAAQQQQDQRFVRQLAAQEGLPQQTGMVSDNNLLNNLATFMGMNPNGPTQTGAGPSRGQQGGNSRTIKYVANGQRQGQGGQGGQGRQSQGGGCCGSKKRDNCGLKKRNVPYGKTTHIGPNQLQNGGTLSNGLGYSPFVGSQMTATRCANSCIPFDNTCAGRQPVYYSETESREACVGRCHMPAGNYASSNLGCRATAFANRPEIDYGTYEDLHGTNLAASAASLPQPCLKRPMN